MAEQKPSSPLPRVVAAATFVILAVIYFFHSRAEQTKGIAPPEPVAIANTADLSGPNAPSASTTNAAASASTLPTLDRARADLIREKLREIALTPAAPSAQSSAKAGDDFPEMPHGDQANVALKNYIHDKIHDDYLPLAKSCYENGLAKDPTLSGRLVMKFKIVGDKRVGGVVDSVETDPETTMHDDQFLQCVNESLMAVSFDAPPNGGSVTVKYPLTFSNVKDGGDSD